MRDPKVRLVEVDVDTAAYDTGHLPGAVGWNWKTDLETPLQRDIADKEGLEKLLSKAGVDKNTTSCSTATTATGSPLTPSGCSSTTASIMLSS